MEKREKNKMNALISNLIQRAKEDQVKKLSVGAVLMHEGKILMLKRRADDFMPNIYELPGGGLEANESLIDALERELEEETNCKIEKILGYIDHIDFPSSSRSLTRRYNFLVQPKLPMLIQLTEHDNCMWLLPTQIVQYNITQETQKIIKLFVDGCIHYF